MLNVKHNYNYNTIFVDNKKDCKIITWTNVWQQISETRQKMYKFLEIFKLQKNGLVMVRLCWSVVFVKP